MIGAPVPEIPIELTITGLQVIGLALIIFGSATLIYQKIKKRKTNG